MNIKLRIVCTLDLRFGLKLDQLDVLCFDWEEYLIYLIFFYYHV